MKQKLTIIILFILSSLLTFAQEWSKDDSTWLQNVLEGKETLKINEDTKKAIEEGRLIIPPWIRENTNSDLELMKDFSNAGTPDSLRFQGIDPYSMPPAVFALYVFYIEKMDSAYQIKSLIITEEERKQLEALLPTGADAFYPYASDFYPGFVIGGQDFNHILSMIFSAQYRRIAYNRKNATAYKNYYNNGTERPFRITDHERRQINQSVNNKRASFRVSTGNKVGGIDD